VGHLIHWDNEEKTVVLQQYTEGSSKDDLYHLASKSAEMLKQCSHTVHLIIDERQMSLVLNSADMAYLGRVAPQNQGKVVVVVPPEDVRYKNIVHQLGKRLAPVAFTEPHYAESLEEARRYLQEHYGVNYPAGMLE
jgi:hypothetical protein